VTVGASPRRIDARPSPRRLLIAAPVALFGLLALILLWQSLLGGKVLSDGDNILFQAPFLADRPAALVQPANPELDDPVLVFASDLLVIRRDLAAGGDGQWNPYQAAGRPLIASQQTAPFFPLTWLAFIFPFWQAAAWIAALKLLLAAWGTYLLARWNGLRSGPATLAGIAFAFSTYAVDQVQFPTSAVMAMVPWVMLMAGRAARGRRTADVLGLIVAVGLLLCTGSPEFIAIGGGGATAFALYELLRAPAGGETSPRASRARRLALIVGGALGGVALAAVAVLPFAAYLGVANTVSRGGPPDYPNNIALGFLFPELWGRPDLAIGQFGPINYLERTAYFGALPVLLALAGLAARRPRGAHLFWGAFTIVAGLIALNTPVHTALSSAPGTADVNLLRTLYLVVLGGAILAGFGLQRWLDGDRRERRRMLIVLVVAALAPAAFLLRHSPPFSHFGDVLAQLPGLHHSFAGKSYIRQVVAWRWLLLGALGIGLLLLRSRIGARAVAILAITLLSADLIAIDYGYNPSIPLAEANPRTPPALTYLQAHAAHTRISGTLSPSSVSLQADMAERYRLMDVGSYNFPKAERWARLWGAYGQSTGDQNDWDPTLPLSHAVLDAFAVRYVVVPHGVVEPAWLQRVFSDPSGDVFENPTALPRAWIAYGWRPADGPVAAAAATVASSTAQLERRPLLEGAPSAPAQTAAPSTDVRFAIDDDEHVRLIATTRRFGYLVLDDSFYSGWQVTIDGHSARILAANENFRAVALPAGRDTVDFTYRPASVCVATWLSVLSVLGLLGAALVLAARHLGRPRAPGPRTSPARRIANRPESPAA
jgi:hypothetical protein